MARPRADVGELIGAEHHLGGSMIRAATVTTAAATVTHTTASRQPHIRLMAAVSGLPSTSARLVPT